MRVELLKKYLYSPEFQRKLDNRLSTLKEAEVNPVFRAEVWLRCKSDWLYFVNNFGVVYEPRMQEYTDIPFFPFDYQIELIERIKEAEEKQHDLFIEKTRDMGVTWTVVWYVLWRWLFFERYSALLGSRKEEEVDSKTIDSLFGKLRYAFYSLPQWLRPKDFRKSEHDLHMKFLNPDNGSMVRGESANMSFGRGKRANIVVMDELFFWKFMQESWRSAADTSPTRILISTPKQTSFARKLRESFASQGNLITLHWEQHPFKDEIWYEEQKKRREADPLSVMAELDISYNVDPTMAYYPSASLIEPEEFDYDPSKPLYISADFGVHDHTAIIYWQKDTKFNYCLLGSQWKEKPGYFYLPFLKHGLDLSKKPFFELTSLRGEKVILKRQDYSSLDLEIIKKFNSWKPPVYVFAETAEKKREKWTGLSMFQQLGYFGIKMKINDEAVAHKIRRRATELLLQRTKFSTMAADVLDALQNSVWKSREKDEPKHDEFADFRAAVEIYAVNMVPNIGPKVKVFTYDRNI